jgi:hypothetical protein
VAVGQVGVGQVAVGQVAVGQVAVSQVAVGQVSATPYRYAIPVHYYNAINFEVKLFFNNKNTCFCLSQYYC